MARRLSCFSVFVGLALSGLVAYHLLQPYLTTPVYTCLAVDCKTPWLTLDGDMVPILDEMTCRFWVKEIEVMVEMPPRRVRDNPRAEPGTSFTCWEKNDGGFTFEIPSIVFLSQFTTTLWLILVPGFILARWITERADAYRRLKEDDIESGEDSSSDDEDLPLLRDCR